MEPSTRRVVPTRLALETVLDDFVCRLLICVSVVIPCTYRLGSEHCQCGEG